MLFFNVLETLKSLIFIWRKMSCNSSFPPTRKDESTRSLRCRCSRDNMTLSVPGSYNSDGDRCLSLRFAVNHQNWGATLRGYPGCSLQCPKLSGRRCHQTGKQVELNSIVIKQKIEGPISWHLRCVFYITVGWSQMYVVRFRSQASHQ